MRAVSKNMAWVLRRSRFFICVLLFSILTACSNQPEMSRTDSTHDEATALLDQYSSLVSDSVLQAQGAEPDENKKTYKRVFEDGKELTYRIMDGRIVVSDDMVAGTELEFATKVNEYYKRKRGQGNTIEATAVETERCISYFIWCTNWDTRRWPDAKIYYEIGGTYNGYTFTAAQRSNILAAITTWEEKSPLRFVPATSGNRVIFRPDPYNGDLNACYAETGYYGRVQYVWLPPTCQYAEILHEIGHTSGLEHEHQRCDRDNFVTINYSNVLSGRASAFDKLCGDRANDLGNYDHNSIMHYRYNAFAANSAVATITSRTSTPVPKSNPTNLTYFDITYGVWYRYRSFFPLNVGSGSYIALKGSTSFGVSSNAQRMRVWIRGDRGSYLANVYRYQNGVSTYLGTVTSDGDAFGYINNLIFSGGQINVFVLPLSGATSADVFYQTY
jgi:hypothetical protein